MGVSSTNRIINPAREYKIALIRAVEQYDRKKSYKKHRGIRAMMKSSSLCSQCKGKMRNDIAKAQIENKRENAPICIPCIMGYKRKPVGSPDKPRWQAKTLKAIDTFNKNKTL